MTTKRYTFRVTIECDFDNCFDSAPSVREVASTIRAEAFSFGGCKPLESWQSYLYRNGKITIAPIRLPARDPE